MRRERTFVARAPRCRVPTCSRDAKCRGLCRSCYQTAYLLTKHGVSWEDLERRGKVAEVRTVKDWLLK